MIVVILTLFANFEVKPARNG